MFEDHSLRQHSRAIARVEKWLDDSSTAMHMWWDLTPAQLAPMMLVARSRGHTAAGNLLSNGTWHHDHRGAPCPGGPPHGQGHQGVTRRRRCQASFSVGALTALEYHRYRSDH